MIKASRLMKVLIACALVVASLAIPATAFANSQSDTLTAQQVSAAGSWQVNKKASAVKLPAAVNKAFKQATKKYDGMTFVPMAYYGTQVVSGTKYVLICKGTTVTQKPKTSLKRVTIYVNLKGKAKITKVKNFKLSKFAKDKDYDATPKTGGWTVPKNYTVAKDMPKKAKKAFKKATKKLGGVSYKPIAYLGKQTVSGTNYMFLCYGKTSTQKPVKLMQVVTVYQNLKGSAKVTSSYTLIPV